MTSLTLTRSTVAHGGIDFGVMRALRGLANNLGRVFASMAAGQNAANDYQRVNSRTDNQLSAKGLRRADVARSVFDRNFG